jgi:hypothetical protein
VCLFTSVHVQAFLCSASVCIRVLYFATQCTLALSTFAFPVLTLHCVLYTLYACATHIRTYVLHQAAAYGLGVAASNSGYSSAFGPHAGSVAAALLGCIATCDAARAAAAANSSSDTHEDHAAVSYNAMLMLILQKYSQTYQFYSCYNSYTRLASIYLYCNHCRCAAC